MEQKARNKILNVLGENCKHGWDKEDVLLSLIIPCEVLGVWCAVLRVCAVLREE